MEPVAAARSRVEWRMVNALRRAQSAINDAAGRAILGFIERVETAIKRTPDGERTFFDPSALPWVANLEASWPLIRQELDAIMPRVDLLPSFDEISPVEVGGDGWKVFLFLAYGIPLERNRRRCPNTARLIDTIPGVTSAMFSILKAGRRLPEHRGPYSGILRYHLGLVVPEGQCAIRVGSDVKFWQEGKSLMFDDARNHEAWNDSDRDRVVLFVDVLRPLPLSLALANRAVIWIIRNSSWIQLGRARWAKWESRFGEELEKVIAAAR